MRASVRESSRCVGDQGSWTLRPSPGGTQPRVTPWPSQVQVTQGPRGWQRKETGDDMRDLSNYLRDTMEKTPSKTDWLLLSEILSGRLFAACCGFNTETIKFVTICTNLKKHNQQDFFATI